MPKTRYILPLWFTLPLLYWHARAPRVTESIINGTHILCRGILTFCGTYWICSYAFVIREGLYTLTDDRVRWLVMSVPPMLLAALGVWLTAAAPTVVNNYYQQHHKHTRTR